MTFLRNGVMDRECWYHQVSCDSPSCYFSRVSIWCFVMHHVVLSVVSAWCLSFHYWYVSRVRTNANGHKTTLIHGCHQTCRQQILWGSCLYWTGCSCMSSCLWLPRMEDCDPRGTVFSIDTLSETVAKSLFLVAIFGHTFKDTFFDSYTFKDTFPDTFFGRVTFRVTFFGSYFWSHFQRHFFR